MRDSRRRLGGLVLVGAALLIGTACPAEKYQAASALEPDERMRQFLSLFSRSFKVNVEINDLFKQQIGLVNDEEIKDAQTFEERVQRISAEIAKKVKERDELQSKGREMIGIKR